MAWISRLDNVLLKSYNYVECFKEHMEKIMSMCVCVFMFFVRLPFYTHTHTHIDILFFFLFKSYQKKKKKVSQIVFKNFGCFDILELSFSSTEPHLSLPTSLRKLSLMEGVVVVKEREFIQYLGLCYN